MDVTCRAYSFLNIKSIDEDQRIIEGIASTPTPDRVGDIVNPMGAKFKLPLPLLWQHSRGEPAIGHVEMAKPTKDGIPFKARIAKTSEPGRLKDRLDEAWQSIKLKLVPAVSIGFRPIKYSFIDDGGVSFDEWEWYELSAVTIPAQPEAVITSIKNMDAAAIAIIKKFDTGAPAATGHIERPSKPADITPAATGKSVRVVRLDDPARDRAKPFVIREIRKA